MFGQNQKKKRTRPRNQITSLKKVSVHQNQGKCRKWEEPKRHTWNKPKMALAGNICIENLDTRRPDLEKLLVK